MSIARCVFVLSLAIASATVAQAADKVDLTKLKDKVTIDIGKKLIVQFEQKGNALTGPKIVNKVADKPPTPTFDFSKMGDNYILATQNPFPKDLKFRALARVKGRKDYFETSIWPVKSGIAGIELWQDDLEELVLFDFKLIAGD